MKKLFILFFCIAFVLITGQAFASNSNKTLVVVSPWKAKGMDPVVSGFVFTRMGCLETLTTSDGKGGIMPKLAKIWRVSNDKLTWTFTLQKNVLFHDGTKLTGKVVVKALNRVLAKKKLFKGTSVESITANGLDVIIKTLKPFSALPAYLSHYTTGVISLSSYNDDGSVKEIIGTGFYKLVSTNNETVFDYQSFDNYWGKNTEIKKARYLAISNAETRALMAESGEADISLTISATAKERLQNVKGVSVVSTAIPRVRLLKLNSSLPFFDTVEERLALSLSIDRKGIAESILKNSKTSAIQLMPAVSMWHNAGLKPLEYNPKKAGDLLEKAGWKRGAKGIFEKDGREFAFELITYASRPMLPIVSEALQAQFATVGIRMKISVGKSSIIPARHKDGTIETALLGRNFGLVPDSIGTINADFGPMDSRGAWGASGWESTELNLLIDKYFNTFNENKASNLRNKITTIFQEELMVIPISWYDHHVAVSSRIKGVSLDAFELRPYPLGVKWVK
ncbi:MAG: ABC transporter substrate-binding protein [Desulfobacteraceae bacterium]|nr:ABC transporter substrate-binding protein [Desulfobacteraceae bacterium]